MHRKAKGNQKPDEADQRDLITDLLIMLRQQGKDVDAELRMAAGNAGMLPPQPALQRANLLAHDLWWFIENVTDETPDRTERFFRLRVRFREHMQTPTTPATVKVWAVMEDNDNGFNVRMFGNEHDANVYFAECMETYFEEGGDQKLRDRLKAALDAKDYNEVYEIRSDMSDDNYFNLDSLTLEEQDVLIPA